MLRKLPALVLGSSLLLCACGEDFLGPKSNHIVKLNVPGAEVANVVLDLAEAFNFTPVHIFDGASEGFTGEIPDAAVPAIEESMEVDYIQRDDEKELLPPEDPPSDDFMLGMDESTVGIRRIGGPGSPNYNGPGPMELADVHVAVIDTGVDRMHTDLDVVDEYDPVGERTGDAAGGTDPQGHGTHVAGTIGAVANGMGVAGVAPGVKIHAIRVLDSQGYGTIGDIIAGLEYVLEHPEIRVVNMSLGGPRFDDPNDPLKEAIRRLEESGVIVLIAAGNETQDTENTSPAGYDLGIVVSAYDTSNGDVGFADFSNYGDEVDVAAPGVDILSTFPMESHKLLSGTSMATPHVAGAMALYLSLKPDATAADARRDVVESGENGYAGQGGRHPEPLLNVPALVDRAKM